MKIVIFSRYPEDSARPRGGIESVTVVLVKALAMLNDTDVHVVTIEGDNPDIMVEKDNDITIHRLPGSNRPQIFDIMFGPGRKQLVSYINKLKPDILHTHETYGLCLGNISIPHVFTVHGFDHANLIADSAKYGIVRSMLWKYVERRGFASQKHIISITPYVRKMVEPLTRAAIYDIDNPVDERFFKIEHKPESGRILCVGWLNERKNTLGAVEAFAKISGHYPQAKLVIAGQAKEEDYLNRIKQSIRRNDIENKVEMPGHINHTQLERELAKAAALLLPSRQENAPMAISEAMAAGIPVVASNRCGMPFMVADGQSGFLIDPESTSQISECLSRLVGSEQLCLQMGQKGRQIAMERFHPHAVAQKTLAVYKQICTDSR
ncbi:MAG: glycosyltransferase family 4 protein [Sedimentisphaerales bacterium]|nr:glycosyltransferase family 4 protein [Sedimentisphaerales bacterium]